MTLIDRLSKLEGPDRGVDARIWCEVRGVVYLDHYPLMHETQVFYKEKGRRKEQVSGDDIPHAALYTASVDAAIALAETALPGWVFDNVGQDYEGYPNGYKSFGWTVEMVNGKRVQGQALTFPLAICIALLRAKEASNG